jgi:hypothetical protein
MRYMEAGLKLGDYPERELRCRVDNQLVKRFVEFCNSRSLLAHVLFTGALEAELDSGRGGSHGA